MAASLAASTTRYAAASCEQLPGLLCIVNTPGTAAQRSCMSRGQVCAGRRCLRSPGRLGAAPRGLQCGGLLPRQAFSTNLLPCSLCCCAVEQWCCSIMPAPELSSSSPQNIPLASPCAPTPTARLHQHSLIQAALALLLVASHMRPPPQRAQAANSFGASCRDASTGGPAWPGSSRWGPSTRAS